VSCPLGWWTTARSWLAPRHAALAGRGGLARCAATAVSWADRCGLRGAWHRPNGGMPAGRPEVPNRRSRPRAWCCRAWIHTRTPTPSSRSTRRPATRPEDRPGPHAGAWRAGRRGPDALARSALGGGGLPACHRPAGTRPAGRRGAGGAGAAAAAGRSRQAVRTPGKSDPIDALAVARLPGPGLRRTTTGLPRPPPTPGPWCRSRSARPTHRHPDPQRPDRPAGPSTPPTRRPAGPIAAQPGWLRAADRGQAHRRDRRRGPAPLRGLLAMHAGVAPIPVSSGRTDRHRLARGGNRQLNATLHCIAITQLRLPGPGQSYYRRRRAQGDGTGEPSAPSSAARPRRLPAPPIGPAASPHRPHGSRLTEEQPSRPGCPCSG
jgi:hypothetical protein